MMPSILIRITQAKILTVSTISLFGCTTLTTGSHYDETVNFGAYDSFSWVSDVPYVVDDRAIRVSPLTQSKIQQEIQSQLEHAGFSYTENRAAAGFLVAYTVGTRDRIEVSSYPVEYPGNWGWHVYGSHFYVREISEHSYTEGTLGVDIFDGETNKPVWHGWAEKTISASDRQNPGKLVESGVARLFKNFPR